MLGTLGFTVAAIAFVFYGISSKILTPKRSSFDIDSYFFAYIVMAVASLFWAFGTQSTGEMLSRSVIAGDVMLLASTLLLVQVIAPKKHLIKITVGAIVVSVIALAYRAMNVDAYMKDSVLVFNTPKLFGAYLSVVILLVWYRANVRFYEQVVRKKLGGDLLRSSYISANILGYIGIFGFLFAKKSLTITFAFSMLIFAFVVLTILNIYASNISKKGAAYAK